MTAGPAVDPGGGKGAVHSATAVSEHRVILGECPLWDGRVLRWLDIPGQKLFRLEPTGEITVTGLDAVVTAIAISTGPRLLAATRSGIGWLDEAAGAVDQRIDVLSDELLTMNDGATDVLGRFWVGSATYDDTPRGSLYRLDGSRLSAVVGGIMMSNGIDWSPDGRFLYHVDSGAGTVTAWNYSLVDGRISSPTTLVALPPEAGAPDGLTVDSAGNVWVAIWGNGEVWCLDAKNGERLVTVTVPTPAASSCTFGGPDLDVLYITTAFDEHLTPGTENDDPGAGRLYSVRLADVVGVLTHPFVGTI